MREKIVYQLIAKGGGVDGRDHTDKGGKVVACFLTRVEAETAKQAQWCDVVPVVIDMDQAMLEAQAKLNPLDLLALGLGPRR